MIEVKRSTKIVIDGEDAEALIDFAQGFYAIGGTSTTDWSDDLDPNIPIRLRKINNSCDVEWSSTMDGNNIDVLQSLLTKIKIETH